MPAANVIPFHTVDPSGSYNPHKVPAMSEPHRTINRSTYTFPVTESVLLDMLRSAKIMRERLSIPYSFEAACMSYMLDLDSGKVLGKSDYERIWGWSRKQLRGRWEDIETAVENMRTAFGRLESRGQVGANMGPTQGQEQPDSKPDSTERGQPGANEGPSRGQHTIQLSTPTLKEEGEGAPPPSSLAGWGKESPPSEDEVIGYAETIGITRAIASGFWRYYQTQGWEKTNGRRLTDWRTRLVQWNAEEKAKQSPAARRGRSPLV